MEDYYRLAQEILARWQKHDAFVEKMVDCVQAIAESFVEIGVIRRKSMRGKCSAN